MTKSFEILDEVNRRAKASFLSEIPTQDIDEETRKALESASLYFWQRNQANQNTVNVDAQGNATPPTGDQLVRASFRALSQRLLRSRGLDFSRPGVLEAGVKMLIGKPVYPNHDFADINNALGSVSKAWWDSAGKDSDGIQGINCEVSVDALMNLKIARGLLMNPPSINAMSLTVLFEFDYSHPRLVEEHKFWDMVGEEVDGEIVRLIVTKLMDIWEASLVSIGADSTAKILPSNKSDQPGEESFNADGNLSEEDSSEDSDEDSPAQNEEETMELTKEQKEALGFDEALTDVPGELVLGKAVELADQVKEFDGVDIEVLKAKAEISEKYVEEKRTEVHRLAKLAELGAKKGELDEVIENQIKEADFDRLTQLAPYFEKRASERFPDSGRSSRENSDAVDNAGGADESTKEPIGDVGLH